MTILLLATAGVLGALSLVLARRSSAAAVELAVSKAATDVARQEAETRVEQARRQVELEGAESLARSREQLEAEFEESRQRSRAEEARLAERREDLDRRASRSEHRESDLQRRMERLGEQEKDVQAESARLEQRRAELMSRQQELAGLSMDEARALILQEAEDSSRKALARKLKEVEEEVRERAEQTAKNVISMAIQRYAGEYVCERTVSMVTLPNDELKGRIIGREGRNIRALEAATGVDFIIDDTPGTLVISAFNPIRREVAKTALEVLLEDGRIHPTRIESVVRKAEADFHKKIREAGLEAAEEVGVSGVHPEILKLLGALKYRTSYGQNQWQHAIEVAFLAGMMADELKLNVKLAKRAALLHDIGKVLDQTAEGSHALVGAEFARQHGESEVVVNAIASHHEEVPQQTIYACLAQAADAISGARPGARREMVQSYTQRLTDLERISNSFPGVERCYAVQAGREVRVLVENDGVTDEEAVILSRDIARKIESEMSYPGQIKVTVIRETRVVQYAR